MPGADRKTDAFGQPWVEGAPGYEEMVQAEADQAKLEGRRLPRRSKVPVGMAEIQASAKEGDAGAQAFLDRLGKPMPKEGQEDGKPKEGAKP